MIKTSNQKSTSSILSPVELRHRIHENPELMFTEFKTTQILFDNLSKLKNLKIHRPIETGLVVEHTVNDGSYLLFRADIDALPIKERTNWDFASTNDYMHACGHDVHSAILYGFNKEIVDKQIDRNIICVFQPAEEGGGGAEKIISSGILDKFKIENAFALHVTNEYDFGTIASTSGLLFASSVEIDIQVIGKSSHVAFPEQGIDALKAMRKLLDKIDRLIANQEKPVLFGCGKIIGGIARNILAEEIKVECTLRTLSIEKSKEIIKKISKEAKQIEQEANAKIFINLNAFYAEVYVDKELFNKLKSPLQKSYNFIDCGMKMTAEDFGFFTKKYPSFMFWLGTSNGVKHGLHSPYFLPDDKIIDKGIEIYLEILNHL
jgi:N-acetyldiaminopimelate deacetylase